MKFLSFIFTFLILCFSAQSQTSVQFKLTDPQFQTTQTTNATITVQAENIGQNGVQLLPIRLYGITDSTGQYTFTNLYGSSIAGYYQWTVAIYNSSQRFTGNMWVESTNLGTISESLIDGVVGAPMIPGGVPFAWTAYASDFRYSQSTNITANFVTQSQLGNASNSIISSISVATNNVSTNLIARIAASSTNDYQGAALDVGQNITNTLENYAQLGADVNFNSMFVKQVDAGHQAGFNSSGVLFGVFGGDFSGIYFQPNLSTVLFNADTGQWNGNALTSTTVASISSSLVTNALGYQPVSLPQLLATNAASSTNDAFGLAASAFLINSNYSLSLAKSGTNFTQSSLAASSTNDYNGAAAAVQAAMISTNATTTNTFIALINAEHAFGLLTNQANVRTNDSRNLFLGGTININSGGGFTNMGNGTVDTGNGFIAEGGQGFIDNSGSGFDSTINGGGFEDFSGFGFQVLNGGNITILGTGYFVGNAFGITNAQYTNFPITTKTAVTNAATPAIAASALAVLITSTNSFDPTNSAALAKGSATNLFNSASANATANGVTFTNTFDPTNSAGIANNNATNLYNSAIAAIKGTNTANLITSTNAFDPTNSAAIASQNATNLSNVLLSTKQPGSLNLTNWSNIGTNQFAPTNIASATQTGLLKSSDWSAFAAASASGIATQSGNGTNTTLVTAQTIGVTNLTVIAGGFLDLQTNRLTNASAIYLRGAQLRTSEPGQGFESSDTSFSLGWQNGQIKGENQNSILGSYNDAAQGSRGISILGGIGNFGQLSGQTGSADMGTVAGGISNLVYGVGGWAAGVQAQAGFNHSGSWVWNSFDPSFPNYNQPNFSSSGARQFDINSPGGFALNTNNPSGFTMNVSGNINSTNILIFGVPIGRTYTNSFDPTNSAAAASGNATNLFNQLSAIKQPASTTLSNIIASPFDTNSPSAVTNIVQNIATVILGTQGLTANNVVTNENIAGLSIMTLLTNNLKITVTNPAAAQSSQYWYIASQNVFTNAINGYWVTNNLNSGLYLLNNSASTIQFTKPNSTGITGTNWTQISGSGYVYSDYGVLADFSLNGVTLTNITSTKISTNPVRTNWVSGAFWTNNTGSTITVYSDEISTSAALGNTGFMLFYDPAGGHNWETNCNGVTVQVATSIVGMTNPSRMSGPVTIGGVICWTNLSTVGSSSLQNGYYAP